MTATSMIGVPSPLGGPGGGGRHSTYVQIRGPGGFFASCQSCGSDPFPDRQTLAQAEADARAHGTLRHLYPHERLLAHDRASRGPVR
jgi:hypothetical protein